MDGEIRNDRNQIVAKDTGVLEAVMQMIGFYPASATTQYDANRLTNYARDVGKEYTAEVVAAYIKADTSEKASIRRNVVKTNHSVGRDSPFFISSLGTRVATKLKSNKQTSAERNLKSLPKNTRRLGVEMLRLRGLDRKGIPTE